MPKVQMDQDAFKGFFVRHVEKMVLGVVLLLFVVFVYSGYSLEGLDRDRSPEKLDALTVQASEHIVKPTWPVIAEEHRPPSGFEEVAKQSNVLTKDLPYSLAKPFMPSTAPSGAKRVDPELLAPIELEAVAVVGPVAYAMKKGEQDPLLDENDSEMAKAETKRKKKKKKRGGGDMMAMMMGMGEDDEGGMEEYMMMGEEGGMMGMMGMMGEEGGMTNANAATARGRDLPGFRPSGTSVLSKPRVIVAVKAVVPYQEQWDKYQQALSEAMGYNPTRDVPKYLTFSAERAEVTDDPNAELKWQQVTNTNHQLNRLRTEGWAGVPKELADPRYLRPDALTMPLPPVMFRDLSTLALHSKVPLQKPVDNTLARGTEAEEETTTEEGAEEGMLSELPGELPGTRGMMAGNMMGGGMMGGGMEGMYGMMGGGEGMAGYGADMSEDMAGMMGGGGYGMEGMGGMYGMEGMEGMYGGGMGGMYGGMGPASQGPPVEYVMVRFFDMTAKPGKKYRYRIQLLVEDPNRPQNPGFEPRERSLADEVKQRLADVKKQEETSERRVYYRRTDWSEPSEVVHVRMPAQTLAGPIKNPRGFAVPNSPQSNVMFANSEPAAKVMAVVFDPERAVDVPTVVEAYRGTYLNLTTTADVIHPVTLQFKNLENMSVETDRLLVDFRGGEPIAGSEKRGLGEQEQTTTRGRKDKEEELEPLNAPSELIFLNAEGDFFVTSDLEDADDFAIYELPTAKAPATGATDGMYEEGAMDMMYEGF